MISVIVPVYNSEKYLEECINSILVQTYEDIELILIDDNSTDNSGYICDEYSRKDFRIKVIHHSTNLGLSISRYDGYCIAKGDYISFIDNDDYIVPWFFEKLYSHVGESQVCCMCGEEYKSNVFREKISIIPNASEVDSYSEKMTESEPLEFFLSNSHKFSFINCIWGKIYKKEHIKKVMDVLLEYKDTNPWLFFEDILFSPISFSLVSDAVFIYEIGYYHRIAEESLSHHFNVSPYLYEAVSASYIIMEYSKNKGYEVIFKKSLELYLMNLQSIWFKVDKCEKNKEVATKIKKGIMDFYNTYYLDYLFRCDKTIYLGAIILFYKYNKLWEKTIGAFYLKKKYMC